MQNMKVAQPRWQGLKASAVALGVLIGMAAAPAQATISATHIYHNHMPNFWPYYDVSQYDNLAVGAKIRYMYDGQVKQLKASRPGALLLDLNSASPGTKQQCAALIGGAAAHYVEAGVMTLTFNRVEKKNSIIIAM